MSYGFATSGRSWIVFTNKTEPSIVLLLAGDNVGGGQQFFFVVFHNLG